MRAGSQPYERLAAATPAAPQRGPVRLGGAALPGRAETDGRVDPDERGPRRVGARGADRGVDRVEVAVAVLDPQHLPAVRGVARAHVLAGEGHRGGSVERDVV